MKEKKNKIIIAIIVVLVLLVFSVVGYILISNYIDKIIKQKIEEQTISYMEHVKNGLTEEENQKIVDSIKGVIEQAELMEPIKTKLLESITVESMKKVYPSMIKYMDYSIDSIEKVESGHYCETITIENIDMEQVINKAVQKKIDSYLNVDWTDILLQGLTDFNTVLNGDLSEEIGNSILETADEMYESDDCQMISEEYEIHVVKKDGEWGIDEDELDIESMAKTCFGLRTEQSE